MQALLYALPPLQAYALKNGWDSAFITALMHWTTDRESRPHPSFALLGDQSEMAVSWRELVGATLTDATYLTDMQIAALEQILDQGVDHFSAVESLFGGD